MEATSTMEVVKTDLVDFYDHNKAASLCILLIASFFGICLTRIIRHQRDPLRKVPSPYLARYTRLWYLIQMFTGESRKTIMDLHEKHGSVVRIAPNEFSISDMEIIREVYGPRTQFEKSDQYIPFTDPGGRTLVSERNNKEHRDLRRKFHASFSMSSVVKMEYLIDEGLRILEKKFTSLSDNGKETDLFHWLKYWSMDNSALLIFGESFGCVEQDADVNGLLALTRASTFYASVVGIIPEWHGIFWRYMPPGIMREKEVRAFSEKRIAEKEAVKDEKRGFCFLDTWFQQKEADRMDRTEVRIGIGGALGGTELTPSFVCEALYHVYREPAILERVRSEIDPAVRSSQVSSGTIISHEAVQGMPYLQAVLKEILRLYPIGAITLPRIVPKGGAYLAGYHFRAGQVIGINVASACYNPEYFGKDPGQYRPERWLGDSEEARKVNHYALPFSMGGRECIGKHVATLMVLKALAFIFYTYDIAIPDTKLELFNDFVTQVQDLKGMLKLRQMRS